MSKVITFSRVFQTGHPKAGQPTYFVDQFWNSLRDPHSLELPPEFEPFIRPYMNLKKIGEPLIAPGIKKHTIREGHRFKAGEYFSPRVWGDDVNPKSGRSGPYQSKQVIVGPDTLIKKEIPFKCYGGMYVVNGHTCDGEIESHHEILEEIAQNDGLEKDDFLAWFEYFKPRKTFDGQIIIWNDEGIDY